MSDIEDIEKEDWRKALRVKVRKGETNSGLAPRDYSVKCSITKLIGVIKGYHLWWCSAHHQPLAWCEKDKMKVGIRKLIKECYFDGMIKESAFDKLIR